MVLKSLTNQLTLCSITLVIREKQTRRDGHTSIQNPMHIEFGKNMFFPFHFAVLFLTDTFSYFLFLYFTYLELNK